MEALMQYNLSKIKTLEMICIRQTKNYWSFYFHKQATKVSSKTSIDRNLFKKLKENNYGKIQL